MFNRALYPLTVTLLTCSSLPALSQDEIEDVIVETYYISDANDATDDIGGTLAPGSKTYRVYLDLCEDCSLRAIFGSPEHPLTISSTAPFFNNLDRGRTFGHEINNSALDENTVALDSWLSLGAASNQRYGVLKADDADGSIIGGANNDGGSANIAGGLLVNTDPAAGIPLTQADGLIPLNGSAALPPNFQVVGTSPSDVLNAGTVAGTFNSSDTRLTCSVPGTRGPDANNRILIAQLTTTGDLTFCINIDVQRADGTVLRFVSSDSLLLEGETPNGLLCYPPACGCTDPSFIEYDPTAGCDDGSCQNAIVFGCLDTLACNYSASANFNVQELCCYGPSDCNGLDVSIVCPDVSVAGIVEGSSIFLFPNPAIEMLHVSAPSNARIAAVTILDALGRVALENAMLAGPNGTLMVPVAHLPTGAYYVVIRTADGAFPKTFIKIDQD